MSASRDPDLQARALTAFRAIVAANPGHRILSEAPVNAAGEVVVAVSGSTTLNLAETLRRRGYDSIVTGRLKGQPVVIFT